MQKKEKNIMPIIIICSLIFYFSNRLSYIYSLIPISNIFLRVNLVIQNISKYFIGLPSFQTTDLFVGIGAVIVLLVIMEIKSGGKKNFRKGVEHGSAEWGTKADRQPFLSRNKRNRVLLSETESIMINEEPADPKNQRNRIMFNLTARQVACFSLAGVVAVPSYIAVKDVVGNQIAVFIVMALAAPFVFFAMFERDGLTGERYLMKIIEFKFKKSAVRVYKNMNFYETMNDIKKLEKNFEENLAYKEEIKVQKKQTRLSSSKRKDD